MSLSSPKISIAGSKTRLQKTALITGASRSIDAELARASARCPIATDDCSRVNPEAREVLPDHIAACLNVPGYGPY